MDRDRQNLLNLMPDTWTVGFRIGSPGTWWRHLCGQEIGVQRGETLAALLMKAAAHLCPEGFDQPSPREAAGERRRLMDENVLFDEPHRFVIKHPDVAEQRLTCEACPTQIEGRLTDGRWFYFRYRFGVAMLGISTDQDAGGPVADALSGRREIAFGDRLDGVVFGETLNDLFRRLMEIEVTW